MAPKTRDEALANLGRIKKIKSVKTRNATEVSRRAEEGTGDTSASFTTGNTTGATEVSRRLEEGTGDTRTVPTGMESHPTHGPTFAEWKTTKLSSYHRCNADTDTRHFRYGDSIAFLEYLEVYPALKHIPTQWVLSSPNTHWVPTPPCARRKILLREDGRFGFDDHTLWPQVLQPHFEYLACIQTRHTNPYIMHWHQDVRLEDCRELVDQPGVYQLSAEWWDETHRRYQELADRVNAFSSDTSNNRFQGHLRYLVYSHKSAGERLFNSRNSVAELQYLWVLVSRLALEISAYLDYYARFLIRLERDHIATPDDSRMGAIVYTDRVAQEFYKMGIPVWQIREKEDPRLFETKMLQLVDPTVSRRIKTGVSPHYPAIIKECDGLVGKYVGDLHDWSRFATLGTGTDAEDDAGIASSSKDVSNKRKGAGDEPQGSKKKRRHKKKKVPVTSTSGLVSVPTIPEQIRCAIFPDLPMAWQTASAKYTDDANDQDRVTFAPDPALFRSCGTMERLLKYVAAWLVVRDDWIGVIKAHLAQSKRPEHSKIKNWKALFTGFFSPNANLESEGDLAKRRIELLNTMGWDHLPSIRTSEMSLTHRGITRTGSLETVVNDRVVMEVMWELHELNWRADFKLLDSHLRPPIEDPVDNTVMIPICSLQEALKSDHGWGISSEEMRELFPVDFSSEFEDKELWRDLTKGVISVAQTMASWVEPPITAPTLDYRVPYTLQDFRALEEDVANTYCRIFRLKMNRYPIVPAVWHEFGWVPSESYMDTTAD